MVGKVNLNGLKEESNLAVFVSDNNMIPGLISDKVIAVKGEGLRRVRLVYGLKAEQTFLDSLIVRVREGLEVELKERDVRLLIGPGE